MDADIDLLVERQDMGLPELLCTAMAREQSVQEVSRILSEEGLQDVTVLAVRIFPDAESKDEARQALTGLVALGAFGRESPKSFPLLPARYHFFSRGIEEATIELAHPDQHDERAVRLEFRRTFRDPATNRMRFRLMTCRKCGELYLEAFEKGQFLLPEHAGRGWRRTVFWLKPKDAYIIPSDSTEEQADERVAPPPAFIHLESGAVKDGLDLADDPLDWSKRTALEWRDRPRSRLTPTRMRHSE